MSETPSEIDVLRAALAAAEVRAAAAEGALVAVQGELTQVQAVVSAAEDMIRHLRLQIAKLRREQYGPSAERQARLINNSRCSSRISRQTLGKIVPRLTHFPRRPRSPLSSAAVPPVSPSMNICPVSAL